MANYRGTENVEMIWNGTQSDPELLYDGRLFNYWDIEDALYDMFAEENPDLDLSGEWAYDAVLADALFDKYVQENCVNYLEDCIFGGYFAYEDEMIDEMIGICYKMEYLDGNIGEDWREEDLRKELRGWNKHELEKDLNRLRKEAGII